MIDQGLRETEGLTVADFVQGSAGDRDLFPYDEFDWIVSRQMLCHLTEVDHSFGAWRHWLKPGGHAILVDGFWGRSGWKDIELAAQPFAALTSAGPVVEAAVQAVRAGEFEEVNTARRADFRDSVTRYVVVARKQWSTLATMSPDVFSRSCE